MVILNLCSLETKMVWPIDPKMAVSNAVLRTQEIVLDLGVRSGAAGVSIHSKATAEDRLLAERPDTAGGARATTGRSLCLEHAATAPDSIPDQDPATSSGRGSFNSDRRNGYGLQWPNIDEFEEWRRSEECAHTIELRVAKVEHGAATLGRSLWTTKHIYRCAHQRVGQRADQRTHPEQQHKIPRKGTGCHCQIVIKRYLHMPVVLGRYVEEHNHDLGVDNLTYTRLSDGTRQQIMSLLIQKVDTCEIVRILTD